MAQLKDSTIDGRLNITGDITMQTNKSVFGIHPTTGEASNMIHMSNNGNTVIGHGGWNNQNGNSYIYGNDIVNYVASAGNSSFRPYYRAGDSINFKVRTSGYVTNAKTYVVFTIPITKPVIGAPTASVSSETGFTLRQNNTYTHGSSAGTPVKPTSYIVDANYNSGFIITAVFDVTTNAINNNPVGVQWDGTITLS